MKALQRDTEIIPEPWNQWTINHLEWLTTPRPNGDGYTLIEDYQPEEAPEEVLEPEPETVPEAIAEEPSDDDEIVVIDGVEYTKAQIRAMMGGGA